MGDLKKKQLDYIVDDEKESFFVECMLTEAEEQTIKRLQTYIQKFYEKQLEKQEQNEGDSKEDGKIQDIQKWDNRSPV